MNDFHQVFLVSYYAIFAFGLTILTLHAVNTDIKRKRKRLQIVKKILEDMRGKENFSESEIYSLRYRYESIYDVPGRWSDRESILYGRVRCRIIKKRMTH